MKSNEIVDRVIDGVSDRVSKMKVGEIVPFGVLRRSVSNNNRRRLEDRVYVKINSHVDENGHESCEKIYEFEEVGKGDGYRLLSKGLSTHSSYMNIFFNKSKLKE